MRGAFSRSGVAPAPNPAALLSAIDVSSAQPRDLSALIATYKPAAVICKLYLPEEIIPVAVRVSGLAPEYTVAQAASARAHGCKVGGYVWCYRDIDPALTVQQALATAQLAGIALGVLWLDVEPYNGSCPDGDWIRAAAAAALRAGQAVGIYTGAWVWDDYISSAYRRRFGTLPLWVADYNHEPTLDVGLFGAWLAAAGHQYSDQGVDQSVFRADVFAAA